MLSLLHPFIQLGTSIIPYISCCKNCIIFPSWPSIGIGNSKNKTWVSFAKHPNIWGSVYIWTPKKYHQEFQVPKMEGFLNLVRLFGGWVSPYISLKYSLYRWKILHFAYQKCLVKICLQKTTPFSYRNYDWMTRAFQDPLLFMVQKSG